MQKENLQNKIHWILQEKYNGKLTAKAKKDIERLRGGEPVDYIIGFVEFLGCKIDLSKKPLIPRPETEYWVQKTISEIYSDFKSFENQSIRILDMFAGSGCIGIAVLKHVKNSHVTFAEKDKKLLEQIRINLKLNKEVWANSHELAHGARVLQSDIFSNVKGGYDYIFANPPYIAIKRKNKIQKFVLKYEPKQSLFGGQDGLFYIRKFLAEAKNFLNPKGTIYMEFDYIQKKRIEKLLKIYRYKQWEFKKDQYGRWRSVEIQ